MSEGERRRREPLAANHSVLPTERHRRLFLAQSISGIGLAIALLVYRRVGALAIGVAYLGGSVVALLISGTVGFLGLHDGFNVPWAAPSLIIELIGFLALTGAGAALPRHSAIP